MEATEGGRVGLPLLLEEEEEEEQANGDLVWVNKLSYIIQFLLNFWIFLQLN